ERPGTVAAVEGRPGGHQIESSCSRGHPAVGAASRTLAIWLTHTEPNRQCSPGSTHPGRKRTVHPPSWPVPGALPLSLSSGPVNPVAPEGDRLRLLPSGPDLVHGPSSPRDRTIDASRRGADPGACAPREGIQPR